MNVANEIQLGKKYSLARAVVQMEDFTAAELTALTGVTPSTVEHFIHTLSKLDQVRKVSLPQTAEGGRGRVIGSAKRVKINSSATCVRFG